jgi:hypothetical protein
MPDREPYLSDGVAVIPDPHVSRFGTGSPAGWGAVDQSDLRAVLADAARLTPSDPAAWNRVAAAAGLLGAEAVASNG